MWSLITSGTALLVAYYDGVITVLGLCALDLASYSRIITLFKVSAPEPLQDVL